MKKERIKIRKILNLKPRKIQSDSAYAKRVILPADSILNVGSMVFVHELDNGGLLIRPVELFEKGQEVCEVCGWWLEDGICRSKQCRGKNI